MILNNKVKEELNRLIRIYDGIHFTNENVMDIFDILNSSYGYNGNLNVGITTSIIPNTNLDTGCIFINPIGVFDYISALTKDFYSEDEKEKQNNVDNYYLLLTILHELAHVSQYNLSKNNSYLGDYYSLLIDSFTNPVNQRKYAKKLDNFDFSFERNANLEALKELDKLDFNEEIKKICNKSYIYELSSGYKVVPKLMSPSEVTFKYFKIKNFDKDYTLSLYDRAVHGLPLYVEELDYLYNLINDNLSIKEINKKLIMK